MKFLKALCYYFEDNADVIKTTGIAIGLVLIVLLFAVRLGKPELYTEEMNCFFWSGVALLAVGTLFPCEKTWFNWRLMLEKKD